MTFDISSKSSEIDGSSWIKSDKSKYGRNIGTFKLSEPRRLFVLWSGSKFVILTGFNEFEFVLLKPLLYKVLLPEFILLTLFMFSFLVSLLLLWLLLLFLSSFELETLFIALNDELFILFSSSTNTDFSLIVWITLTSLLLTLLLFLLEGLKAAFLISFFFIEKLVWFKSRFVFVLFFDWRIW